MKFVWALIVALFAAAAVFVFMPTRGTPNAAPTPASAPTSATPAPETPAAPQPATAPQAQPAPAVTSTTPATPTPATPAASTAITQSTTPAPTTTQTATTQASTTPAVAPAPTATPTASANPAPASPITTTAPTTTTVASAGSPAATTSTPTTPATITGAPTTSAPASAPAIDKTLDLDKALGLPEAPKPAVGFEAAAAKANESADKKPASSPAESKPADSKPSESKPALPADAVRQADGSLLIDGKFTLKGEGSRANPYEITWEYLTSAQQDYDPSKGKKDLPARLTMLDKQRVRITGYVAFPLYVQQPRELLVMLNQWDGCCIGVPPTPYDAIEVRTADVIKGDDRFATFGTVEGTLQVKPYVVGDWLVGLFIMEDAALKPRTFDASGS